MKDQRMNPHARTSLRRHDQHLPRAFSLIEMMVVLGILVLVLAIVLPALNSARVSARKSATQSLMNGLQTASAQFTLSERRLPGYFGTQAMADNVNAGRGFTTMDNILLDLAGGITQAARNVPGGDPCVLATDFRAVIEVGPTTTETVRVSVSSIGATKAIAGVQTKGYFQPDKRYFAAQCLVSKRKSSVNPDHFAMPVVIDAFGHPVLAWSQDERIAPDREFAAENGTTRARFYRVPNIGFLEATALGEFGIDQRDTQKGSLLGITAIPDMVKAQTMAAILGNPNSPDPTDNTMPSEARGKLLYHSAGPNGVYLGIQERGGKIARANGNALPYTTGKDWANDGSFDDIILTGGN